jgi:hypothetical protein
MLYLEELRAQGKIASYISTQHPQTKRERGGGKGKQSQITTHMKILNWVQILALINVNHVVLSSSVSYLVSYLEDLVKI